MTVITSNSQDSCSTSSTNNRPIFILFVLVKVCKSSCDETR